MTNKIHNIVIINSVSDFTSSYPIPKQRWILEGVYRNHPVCPSGNVIVVSGISASSPKCMNRYWWNITQLWRPEDVHDWR